MIFTQPVQFETALESRRVRSILPTTASSAELMQLAPELRERAMFSARTGNADYLTRLSTLIDGVVSPETVTDPDTGERRPARPGEYMDVSTARMQAREYLLSTGYEADAAERGTIKDLSSEARLNLIIDTNVKMAAEYAYWQQGQDPAILDMWPAKELIRVEARNEQRDWRDRWNAQGGRFSDSRMIALKNDPIWTRISAFGLPYPPFDFNSGMGTQDVDREEAMRLGLIDRDTQIQPESRGFNEDLEASVPERDARLRDALVQSMAGAAEIVGGVLRFVREEAA